MKPDLMPPARSRSAEPQVQSQMRSLYDHYFASHAYDQRYPRPNPHTLRWLLANGVGQATKVLDFGCGSGRYALPLLHLSQAQVVGFDISSQALAELATRRAHLGSAEQMQRLHIVYGPLANCAAYAPFERVLALFGVLSHVGERTERVATLRALRQLCAPGGRLLLSVPNQWRRRPLELLRTRWQQWRQRSGEPGDIRFTRQIAGQPQTFFYHLYSAAGLRAELAQAGWRLCSLSAESLLPEWLITQHPRLGQLDAALTRYLPASWGYGLCAVAQAAQEDGA